MDKECSWKSNRDSMREVETDENYDVKRFVVDSLGIEYGFWRVMFGVRFRAGWKGKSYTEIDWCCGDLPENIMLAQAVFEKAVKNYGSEVFSHLPSLSKVKPFHKDEEFMKRLTEI